MMAVRSSTDLRALRARICAIGPATRAALEALHLKVDLIGDDYVAEGLLKALEAHDLAGKRILLPRAAVARDLLPIELKRRGALVEVVEAYRTAAPERGFDQIDKPDWITFTSSSTVQNFVAMAGATALSAIKVASIGPVTSAVPPASSEIEVISGSQSIYNRRISRSYPGCVRRSPVNTSIFELFKIGIGPSSSHTVGPMRAARSFALALDGAIVGRIQIELYGSLGPHGPWTRHRSRNHPWLARRRARPRRSRPDRNPGRRRPPKPAPRRDPVRRTPRPAVPRRYRPAGPSKRRALHGLRSHRARCCGRKSITP